MAAIETETTAGGRTEDSGGRARSTWQEWRSLGAARGKKSRWWLLGKQSSSLLGLGHFHSYLGADSISARCRLKIIIYIYL